ncbi:MAG: alpha/beta hydrolase [Victivallaceae bacterium]|nr:alpha/beta hydrolase [Victivallaceae bacterium]
MLKQVIAMLTIVTLLGFGKDISARTMRVPAGVKVLRNLEYANFDGHSLRLDLYLPENQTTKPKLLVWIHGGGWKNGSKSRINPTIIRLTADGYAAASIDYRLLGLQSHPAQINECKAAIRWLRAHAEKYGYDATKIGVGGGSAGGHLALLLGLSGDVKELEGTVGGNLDQSSRVQAVVDLFGPSALVRFSKTSKRFMYKYKQDTDFLNSASPITYLSKDDPPVLILQGDQDRVVPKDQSEYLHKRYQAAGLDSELYIIKGASHGGRQFSDKTRHALIKTFLDKHIKAGSTAVTPNVTADKATVKKNSETKPIASIPHKIEQQRLMHGIYWMGGTGRGLSKDNAYFERYFKRFKQNLKQNPYVTGVYLAIRWNDFEPQNNKYNFDRLDRLIQAIRDAGKTYKLSLVPGIHTPKFVYQNGAAKLSTKVSNKFRPNYGEEVNIPLPWNKKYQTYFFQAVGELAQHYASDKQLIAVSMTVANFMSPELHLPRSKADIKQWQQHADYQHKIAQAWRTSLDRFATLFPEQQLCVELAMPITGMGDDVEDMIEYGIKQYPQRFTIQSDQLNGKHDNMKIFSYQTILKYKDQLHNGFQNVAGWRYPKSRQRQGSMEQTVTNYNRTGAEYFEIWYGDGESIEICRKLTKILTPKKK